jgi:phosphatidylserine decarboxylase|tara:strand:+ start:294 stop:656 length:363 start_codon:yes stop_codon:yes gene_type:complete
MNVFNVHVNRSPIAGKVKKIAYTKGSFLNASLDKASEKNERNALVIQTKDNVEIVVVQIAGLIARRILSFIKDGHTLSAGERFGLIRFGSRVDIYFPINAQIDCSLNQKVVAGESVLASL